MYFGVTLSGAEEEDRWYLLIIGRFNRFDGDFGFEMQNQGMLRAGQTEEYVRFMPMHSGEQFAGVSRSGIVRVHPIFGFFFWKRRKHFEMRNTNIKAAFELTQWVCSALSCLQKYFQIFLANSEYFDVSLTVYAKNETLDSKWLPARQFVERQSQSIFDAASQQLTVAVVNRSLKTTADYVDVLVRSKLETGELSMALRSVYLDGKGPFGSEIELKSNEPVLFSTELVSQFVGQLDFASEIAQRLSASVRGYNGDSAPILANLGSEELRILEQAAGGHQDHFDEAAIKDIKAIAPLLRKTAQLEIAYKQLQCENAALSKVGPSLSTELAKEVGKVCLSRFKMFENILDLELLRLPLFMTTAPSLVHGFKMFENILGSEFE